MTTSSILQGLVLVGVVAFIVLMPIPSKDKPKEYVLAEKQITHKDFSIRCVANVLLYNNLQPVVTLSPSKEFRGVKC